MSELYRDYIDGKADEIINSLGGTITPAPANAELYRDFLDRKFDDVINAIGNVKVKSFTYTGDGTNTLQINMPANAKYILSIQGNYLHTDGVRLNSVYMNSLIDLNNLHKWVPFQKVVTASGTLNGYVENLTYNNNILTIPIYSTQNQLNISGATYTVYYI